MTTDILDQLRDLLERGVSAPADAVLADAVAEIERLREAVAVARINPEDYMNADNWSDDCRGTMTPIAQHDLCDDPDCGCPCHTVGAPDD